MYLHVSSFLQSNNFENHYIERMLPYYTCPCSILTNRIAEAWGGPKEN